MIKLFTHKDISVFSSDAVYKICLALDQHGLSEENIESFDSYDEIYSAAIPRLEQGEHIIIAVEPNDYINAKKELVAKLILESEVSSEIAEVIALNAGDDISEIDMEGHCIIPSGSIYHLTDDGLYSGFTARFFGGKLSFIPLDFMRIDSILVSLSENERLDSVARADREDGSIGLQEDIQMPEYDFTPSVSKMVSTLSQLGKKVALATSEATMWIYNLYDKVDGLTETINFVEVLDAPQDTAASESESVDGEEIAETDSQTEEEQENGVVTEEIKESESMRAIRHAREAMYNTDCEFGGAISEIYTSENENGDAVYYAYVAVVDRSTAKAKKINTTNPDDLPLILPHAVTILSDVVCDKTDVMSTAIARIDYEETEDSAPKAQAKSGVLSLSKGMIAFACVVLVVSLISPMLMTYMMLKPQSTTQPPYIGPSNPPYYTDSSTTAPSTTNPFVTSAPDPFAAVTEPSAPDVSAESTSAAVSSNSGVFTFYVFGYGHGVGMSQIGANYLASREGWSAAEILAHYYYDPNTKILTGDVYPETIKYAGTSYKTREYLASALESEMSSSFAFEALKAQAIALYTFAKYNGYNLSADAHAFGKTPSANAYKAVDSVMESGLYISHGGDVAVTPFHAMSAGLTTSYYNVWGKGIGASVPYLSGARQSPGDYLDSNFKSTYTITSDDLKALIKETSGVELSGDPSTWLSIVSHDKAVRDDIGYVSTINVGGTMMTGNDFRIKVMQGRIRSHCFALVYTPNA